MAYLLRLLASVLVFVAWVPAHASFPTVGLWYFESPANAPRYPSQAEACKAGLDYLKTLPTWSARSASFTRYDGYCYADMVNNVGNPVNNFAYGRIYSGGTGCPSNSSQSGSTCSCNSGYLEEGGQCVEGMSSEKACGAAFYNSNAFGNTSLPVVLDGQLTSGSYCQPQGDSIKPGLACAMNFDLEVSWKTDDGNWHSRGTLQPKMIGPNFQPCVPGLDASTNPPDPDKPPELPKKQDPTCPNGYQGQVGTETKCVPSYGYNGVNFAPTTKYDEDAKTRTETTTKTECASGKCTTTDTVKVTDKATGQSTTTSSSTTEVDRAWCAKAENKDKCAANGKPAYSGQDTGVSSGSGSNGSGGDGDGEEKGGRCGAKGQPPCKIDETGTPDGEGKFDSALDKQAQDHQQRMDTLSGIKNSADKDTSTGTNGGFQWLTHKTCSPWNLGEMKILTETFRLEINICAIEPYVVPVMNFLWILATIWMTFARVASVMGAKVD
ncbi:hypothetical protein [Comamonas thiooxydans]|uniref:hypothetical protein n=1 Tax=Comamonas thiooxydans TaxID=363952 RepID=UPI0015A73D6F|nr:hypothetical protein [Comamonas thiooxydans]